ncbi:MAG TPA: YbdK family carboxylate-amine ligase [Solirubrobacterales bacterium]|nr:YbdK family carboxylate-amine ligase [Solirubrobacterales bacterium]
MSDADGINPGKVREVFESSRDFTVGLEEEFALLDPETLDLVPEFERFEAAALRDPVLADSIAGELISSEIEIRSGRAESFGDAVERQAERRARLFGLAPTVGVELGAMGVHPWASYLDQQIIDTPHYRRVRDELRWVAQRNNTWSLHLHMGIRGADRAIAVCDHLRGVLPLLLAISANSPWLDGHDTGLASVRTQIFTRTFPRCGIPEAFGDWEGYARFVELLARTGSIVEPTQLWWSVRPHHLFGTVEVRICDAQSDGGDSTALAGLIAATIAQLALDYDRFGYASDEAAGGGAAARRAAPFGPGAGSPPRGREIEENLWRAIRYGVGGEMIDFSRGEAEPTLRMAERLFEWTEPARELLGIETEPPRASGAEAFRALVAETGSVREAYRETLERTRLGYAGGAPVS